MNKDLRKKGLEQKRLNQLFQIVDNSFISNVDKILLKKEIEHGLISDKNVLKQKIKEKPKNEDSFERYNSHKYNKNKKYDTHKKPRKYEDSTEFKQFKNYKKLKPINTDKDFRNGLNRQDSIYGVRMSDLMARDAREEEIYVELNECLATNKLNKTWYLLKRSLKTYPDNPIFLYYKALALYRNKNFDYADDCILKARYNAKKHGLSDAFINKCNDLLDDENVRFEVSTKKRYKRPSRRVYKNNKQY